MADRDSSLAPIPCGTAGGGKRRAQHRKAKIASAGTVNLVPAGKRSGSESGAIQVRQLTFIDSHARRVEVTSNASNPPGDPPRTRLGTQARRNSFAVRRPREHERVACAVRQFMIVASPTGGRDEEFDLKELGWNHLRLSRSYDAGSLKRKLHAGIGELERAGCLELMSDAERFQKNRPGHWRVAFIKADSPSRPTSAATAIPPHPLTLPLIERVVTAAAADAVLRRHAPERIRIRWKSSTGCAHVVIRKCRSIRRAF
jgi:hypothetical protein